MQSALRSIELNPSNVVGLLWGASILTAVERFDDAQEWLERARLLDPLSPYVAGLASFSHLMQHRDREALDCVAPALEANPDYPVALYFTAAAHMRCGDQPGRSSCSSGPSRS